MQIVKEEGVSYFKASLISEEEYKFLNYILEHEYCKGLKVDQVTRGYVEFGMMWNYHVTVVLKYDSKQGMQSPFVIAHHPVIEGFRFKEVTPEYEGSSTES